jgi:Tfp pilus assembly protein PilN
MSNQLWGAVAVIVLGYVLGFYFQSRSIAHLDKRIDDLRAELNHRFDDLKDWICSEVKRLEDRIEHVEHAIIKG